MDRHLPALKRSCNDPRLHFGLGEAITADLTIHWPSRLTEQFPNVGCDKLITIQETRGIIPNKGWSRH